MNLIIFKKMFDLGSRTYRNPHEAPVIEPFDFVIIDVNTHKEIECKAKKPVTWAIKVHFL